MSTFTISGREFVLERATIVESVERLLPDPLYEHYVVVEGRRFPPKQVISAATGLDKADFTTHQARRVLKRLGFTAARVGHLVESASAPTPEAANGGRAPYGGRQAEALRPYAGKWVALAEPTEVLIAADSPQEVLAWLARHERQASYGMFRVPVAAAEAEGAAPQ